MTATLVGLRVSWKYRAMPAPWVASVANRRWNVSQPFFDRSTLVAEGVMVGEAGGREGGSGVLRLTGEGRADHADDIGLVDELLGEARGLVGRALRVLRLELDLAVGVGLVELVDGQLGAVLDRLAEAGGVAGQRLEAGDGEVLAGRAASGRGGRRATGGGGRRASGRGRSTGGRGGRAAAAVVVVVAARRGQQGQTGYNGADAHEVLAHMGGTPPSHGLVRGPGWNA